MSKLWGVFELPRTSAEAIAICRDKGLLPASKNCPVHRKPMKLYEDRAYGRFRCTKSNCNKTISGAAGSFFSESKLELHIALALMYFYTINESYEKVNQSLRSLKRTSGLLDEGISSATIAIWYKHCREMVVDHFNGLQENLPQLGGPGVIVQVDESLFGHRTSNKCRVLNGHWVLGMIDQNDNVRIVVVERRDPQTILGEIQKCVAPGSEIHTDSWCAYEGLSALPSNFIHRKVNHNDPEHRFVAPDGAQNQKIVATWRPAKQDFFRGRSRFGDEHFADRLCEYLWRLFCRKNGQDLFEALLEAVKAHYPV